MQKTFFVAQDVSGSQAVKTLTSHALGAVSIFHNTSRDASTIADMLVKNLSANQLSHLQSDVTLSSKVSTSGVQSLLSVVATADAPGAHIVVTDRTLLRRFAGHLGVNYNSNVDVIVVGGGQPAETIVSKQQNPKSLLKEETVVLSNR